MAEIPEAWGIVGGQIKRVSWGEGLTLPARNGALLTRGIAEHHICVISPVLQGALLNAFPHARGSVTPDKLEWITGRRTWVIQNAPSTVIEYMSLTRFARKYPEDWKAEIAAKRRMRKR